MGVGKDILKRWWELGAVMSRLVRPYTIHRAPCQGHKAEQVTQEEFHRKGTRPQEATQEEEWYPGRWKFSAALWGLTRGEKQDQKKGLRKTAVEGLIGKPLLRINTTCPPTTMPLARGPIPTQH